jgi:hypothetical protein
MTASLRAFTTPRITAPSYPIGRRRPYAAKPDLSLRASRPQPCDGRIVVIVKLEITGADVDGDELAVVVGAKHRSNPAVEDLSSESGQFFWSPL